MSSFIISTIPHFAYAGPFPPYIDTNTYHYQQQVERSQRNNSNHYHLGASPSMPTLRRIASIPTRGLRRVKSSASSAADTEKSSSGTNGLSRVRSSMSEKMVRLRRSTFFSRMKLSKRSAPVTADGEGEMIPVAKHVSFPNDLPFGRSPSKRLQERPVTPGPRQVLELPELTDDDDDDEEHAGSDSECEGQEAVSLIASRRDVDEYMLSQRDEWGRRVNDDYYALAFPWF